MFKTVTFKVLFGSYRGAFWVGICAGSGWVAPGASTKVILGILDETGLSGRHRWNILEYPGSGPWMREKIRGLACFWMFFVTVIDCDWLWSRMNVDEEWAACDWQILGFWTPKILPGFFLRFRVRSRGLGELDPLCFPGFRKMIVHNNSHEFPWIPMNFLWTSYEFLWISHEFPMNFRKILTGHPESRCVNRCWWWKDTVCYRRLAKSTTKAWIHPGPLGSPKWIPSGYVNIAIENHHWNSEFSHEKLWFSIAMLNYQRVSQQLKISKVWSKIHQELWWFFM